MKNNPISRRRFLQVSGGAAAALAATAGLPNLSAFAQGQFAGKKVRVVTEDSPISQGIEAQMAGFTALTGATIELSKFPQDQFRAKITADLASGTGLYDVLVEPFLFLHDHVAAGLLQPLDKLIAADKTIDLPDFIPAVLKAYNFGGSTLYSVPYKVDVQMLYYRKDLFADPKIQAAFKAKTGKDLKVPETNADLIEVARYFTKSLNPDSPTDYGWVTWGEKTGSFWWWAIRLATYGGSYLDANMRPNFNNEAGLKAIDVCQQLLAAAPKDVGQYDWDKMNTPWVRGQVALIEQWPTADVAGVNAKTAWGDSQVVGKVGYAVPPGDLVNGKLVRSSLLGGWGTAMSKFTKDQDLAYAAIAYLTGKASDPLKIPMGNAPARTSTLTNPQLLAANPYFTAMNDALAVATITADVDAAPVSSQLQEELRTALNRVWIGDLAPKDALAQTEAKWIAILKDAGLSK